MSKNSCILFICAWFVVSASDFVPKTSGLSGIAVAEPVAQQKAGTDSVKQEQTEAEKLADKLARLKGEKVTILGTKPPQCPSAPSDDKRFLFYSDEDKERKTRLPLSKHAGQTGVILEAKLVGTGYALTPDIVIQLDQTGEKVVAPNDSGLGFHSELEAAKTLVGKPLWSISNYDTITPTVDPCRHFADAERLRIKRLRKVTVTRVEFGNYEQPIVIFARTDDGREGQVNSGEQGTYFDERFHFAQHSKYYSREFLFDDPRKLHPTWSAAIWKLIEEGEVGIGMTEAMVKLACVDDMVLGKLREEGFAVSRSGKEIAKAYKCSGKRFVIEKGKVTAYVDAPR